MIDRIVVVGDGWEVVVRGDGTVLRATPEPEPEPEPVFEPDPEAVPVLPGESIQAAVNAHPEGTPFLLRAGVHRGQSVIPKSDNQFVGEEGTVLTGEDTTGYAFTGTAVRVGLRNLTVEHYLSKPQRAPVSCESGGWWVVEDCTFQHNAHIGIGLGPRWQVRNCRMLHNGQMGFAGSGEDIVFEGNEVAFNNENDLFSPHWEAGGGKFVYTIRLACRNNNVHDNHGPGLWTDINNVDTLYERNTCADNHGPGIFHEISYRAVIRDNVCTGNGTAAYAGAGVVEGSGILISSSPDVEIYGNTVVGNRGGISGIEANRSPDPNENSGPWQLRNLWVHDNRVEMAVGENGIVRYGSTEPVWTEWGNRYDRNTYKFTGPGPFFRWAGANRDWKQWQALGQDVNGVRL